MTTKIALRSGAQRDTRDAVNWYEEQQLGLGEQFLDELDVLFERIIGNPQQFPEIEDNVRRGLLRRFPYGSTLSHPLPRLN